MLRAAERRQQDQPRQGRSVKAFSLQGLKHGKKIGKADLEKSKETEASHEEPIEQI